MVIFLLIMAIGAICILLIKYAFKTLKMKSLYLSYLSYQSREEEEISEEYLKKCKEQDIDKTIANDLELHKLFKIINRTNSMIGREYMYAQMYTSKHNHEQLEGLILKLQDEKKVKKVLYELYELSFGYHESLNFFEVDQTLTKKDTFIVLIANIILFILIGSCFINIENIMKVFLWLGIESVLYSHYVKKTDNMMNQSISYCYVVECLKKLVKLDIYCKRSAEYSKND